LEIIIALKGFLKSLADGEGEVKTLTTGGKYFEMFTTHYFQALMVFFVQTRSEKYKTITDVATHFT